MLVLISGNAPAQDKHPGKHQNEYCEQAPALAERWNTRGFRVIVGNGRGVTSGWWSDRKTFKTDFAGDADQGCSAGININTQYLAGQICEVVVDNPALSYGP